MWYVVQVRTGSEESIRIQCSKNVSAEVLEKCFIPYYEEKWRRQGVWRTEKKILFPGYIFVVTEHMEELYRQLNKVIGLTKLLGTGTDGPLQGKEGLIKKIDRHKRKAYLELPMFGRMQTVQVGLEIVAKTV